MSVYDFEKEAARVAPSAVEGTRTQIECKMHPGREINRSHDACPRCGIYFGVPANFQVVTYRLVPTEVRQCLPEDL